MPDRPLHPETQLITAGRPPVLPDGPLNAPIVPAAALHPGASGYVRAGHPAWAPLEQAIGVLEGGEAVVFASGMAAAAAAIGLVLEADADADTTGGAAAGGNAAPARPVVVAPEISYQQIRSELQALAARGRIELRLVDVTDTDATRAACAGADALWLESPTNPLLGVADLPALCEWARARGLLCVVDNTLATPLGQRPLTLGADLVIHSATKAIGGHSDLLLGAAVSADPGLTARLRAHRAAAGATPGALEVFLCLRGLRTLALRVSRAAANAGAIAARLAAHPEVSQVRYPGLSGDPGHARAAAFMDSPGFMLTFTARGGAARAEALLAQLRVLVHATSLGGVETTLERRARYPDERGWVPEGLLRVSVGCEHADDLWDDLAQALAATA